MKRLKPKNSPASEAFRKAKLKSVSYWKKKAWTVFSLYIRKRDNYICYTCGKDMKGSRALHAGHFVSRRVNATFFDDINVHAQCMYCNMYNYGATAQYASRLIQDYGQDGFNDLLARARQIKQFTVPELQEIINKYQQ